MKLILYPTLIASLSLSSVSAAVISPTPSSTLDPAGSEEIDSIASGSATVAAFNALSGLQVIGDWTGATATSDIINLADIDIRITTSFSSLYTDGRDTSATLQTSSGGQNFAWSGTNDQSITIEFGTWNGSTFTNDQSVFAAGLAFVNFGAAYDTASDQTVTYFNSSNVALSTQTFAGGADTSGGADIFSGFTSGSGDISYLTIAITRASGNSDIAIDDLSFAPIPEPSTYAMLIGAAALGLAFWRRRKA